MEKNNIENRETDTPVISCGADSNCLFDNCKKRKKSTHENECPYPNNPRIEAMRSRITLLENLLRDITQTVLFDGEEINEEFLWRCYNVVGNPK